MKLTAEQVASAARMGQECDLCTMKFEKTDKVIDDGGEVAHADCVSGWFARNFGREGLA